MISEQFKDLLDGQGAQENEDVLEEQLEDLPRPEIDFSEWNDDNHTNNYNVKGDKGKFKALEVQPMDDLLSSTKSLVPEQKVELQKVLHLQRPQFNVETVNLQEILQNS